MSLSKKNRDKLRSIYNDDLFEKNNKSDSNPKDLDTDNPNDIFYSIIDNSNDINETILINKKLKKSEEKFSDSNNYKYNNSKNISIKLTEEDLLYDEFKYLLDEE